MQKRICALMLCVCAVLAGCFGCAKNSQNYDVVGVWKAVVQLDYDNPYDYGKDEAFMESYIQFREDGTMKNRVVAILNGKVLSDTDWVNANFTYTVDKNTITMTNGNTFVIIDDVFHHIWADRNVTLQYEKISEET